MESLTVTSAPTEKELTVLSKTINLLEHQLSEKLDKTNDWIQDMGTFMLANPMSILMVILLVVALVTLSICLSVCRRWCYRERQGLKSLEWMRVAVDGFFFCCCLPYNCFKLAKVCVLDDVPNRPQDVE